MDIEVPIFTLVSREADLLFPFKFEATLEGDYHVRVHQRKHLYETVTEMFGERCHLWDRETLWQRDDIYKEVFYFRHERDALIFKLRFG